MCRVVMSSMSIDFYDTTDPVDVPQDDPDLEFLAPAGVLRLPPSVSHTGLPTSHTASHWFIGLSHWLTLVYRSQVEKPHHAPVHAGDLLTVARFVEAFRSELKLPKGGLNELQVRDTYALRHSAQD